MKRVSRMLVVVGFASLAMGAGCGKSKGPDPMTGAASQALHLLSTPVHYAQVHEDLKYQAVLSKPGAADWALMAAPQGAKIDQGGALTWTPTEAQAGDQTIVIHATMAGEAITQTVPITAASTIIEAGAHVDPASTNGALIAVDAPLSPIQGTALQIEPGALPPGAMVAVTIGSMAHAPVPAAAKVAGVAPSDLRPVDFGPTGLAFQVPVKVHLPVTAAVLKKGRPEIQTYDYNTGKWEKIKVISVDAEHGIAIGEIKHFSTYVVTPPSTVLNLQLSLGSAAKGSECASALLVRPALAAGLDQLPASAVNGYGGKAASVAEVLSGLGVGESLQIFTKVRARANAATGEQTGWVLASATRIPGGKIKVSVTSDSHGSAFLTTPPELSDSDAELTAWLNGSRVDLVFGGLGALTGGATVSADVSLYLVLATDADRPPPQSANAIGSDEVTQQALTSLEGFDDDCDGAPNQWDPAPQGTPPPQLTGLPPGPAHVMVGSPAGFKVLSNQTGVTFTWTVSDPSVSITSAMGGLVAAATPAKPGLFHINVAASNGTTSSRMQWDLIADPASVQAANTPPRVAIGASAMTVRAGERVVLNAYGKDAEQSQLTFAWYTDNLTNLSAQLGGTVVFAAAEPGDYKVGCIANDGLASSTPAAVVISVISPTANRPPGPPTVSPTSIVLQHAAGEPVMALLKADAADPDGDAVTYDFVPDRFTPTSFTLTKEGALAAFSTSQDGLYLFFVTAQDSHGATSPWTPVKIQVMPTLPPAPVDADKDGYPAGIDCNDNDPAVNPTAKDICGDGVDQNCDGRDLGAADCDGDGDRFTTNQGDCDDKNASISPGAVERCDGIDNNCNGVIDEGYGLGIDCSAGYGACRAPAVTICNASFNGVVCGGNPGKPSEELCDGVDNDCNGQVDDVPGSVGGDVANCGGCNVRCAAGPNSVAACVKGGCNSACTVGWVDTDRNPDNGCECQVSNAGLEICDGLDNDCNGSVDDGASEIFYDGPAGSKGIGVCAAGTRLCMGGKPVTVRAQQIPTPELCDGLDNDCNGKVDDGFDFSSDPRNCGGCNMVCVDGACEGGKCTGGIVTPPVGGNGGSSGGAGGVSGGSGGSGSLGVCNTAAGTYCTDLSFDSANCGACGRACVAGTYCSNGVCLDGATACPAPKLYCRVATDPAKTYCTDPLFDPTNCGVCGNQCTTGPCINGVCQTPTGPAPTADGGTTTFAVACNSDKPDACQLATGASFCTDFKHDDSNCGLCGKVCPAGSACADGVCAAPGSGICESPLSACGTACTTLNDDPVNCGLCGKSCAGVCAAATCQPAGAGKFGDPCAGNQDCGTGSICMDQKRFGWPGGACSTQCDGNRPCAGSTVCVVLSRSSGFGTCRQRCAADSDCAGRPGLMCSGGTCTPDCRTAVDICGDGQTCDPTGHCVVCAAGNCGGTPTCVAPSQACGDAAGKMYCTDVAHDPANCGGCGKACPANAVCTDGICRGGGGAAPGLAVCPGTNGAPLCTNLYSDSTNCGACGTICRDNTYCQGGKCLAPPTCTLPQQMCLDPTGTKQYCTDVNVDSQNCGRCGFICAGGSYCQAGACMTGTISCPATTKPCPQAGGTINCARVDSDPANCGACGLVCPANTVCQNYSCQPNGTSGGGDGGTAPDGGGIQPGLCGDPMAKACPDTSAVGFYCANMQIDPLNCGMCGFVCASRICQNYACVGGTQPPDGGATGITCTGTTKPCSNTAGGMFCAKVDSDPTNCGACGIVCPSGSCQNYACSGSTTTPPLVDGGTQPNCSYPTKACPTRDGFLFCADVSTDPSNCGNCGVLCPSGTFCRDFACMPVTQPQDGGTAPVTCITPMTTCKDAAGNPFCTDVRFDNTNCGLCGKVCSAGTKCLSGTCAVP